jgi:hypothetical protein
MDNHPSKELTRGPAPEFLLQPGQPAQALFYAILNLLISEFIPKN